MKPLIKLEIALSDGSEYCLVNPDGIYFLESWTTTVSINQKTVTRVDTKIYFKNQDWVIVQGNPHEIAAKLGLEVAGMQAPAKPLAGNELSALNMKYERE